MTEIKIFTQYNAVLFCAIIGLTLIECSSISNKRLCFDPKCSEPVSLAKTLMAYVPNIPGLLRFKGNEEVKVYSKSAGNRTDLWGVEINGIRGYVPKDLIREYKVIRRNLTYEVPTELHKEENISLKQIPIENAIPENSKDSITASTTENNVENITPTPDEVSPSYEVIDGTTIHLTPSDKAPATAKYTPQDVHDTTNTDEQPILSVHPNIVSKTLSLVSSVFESVTKPIKVPDDTNKEIQSENILLEETIKLELDSTTIKDEELGNEKIENLEKKAEGADDQNIDKVNNIINPPNFLTTASSGNILPVQGIIEEPVEKSANIVSEQIEELSAPTIESEIEQNVATNISSNTIEKEIVNQVPLVSDYETEDTVVHNIDKVNEIINPSNFSTTANSGDFLPVKRIINESTEKSAHLIPEQIEESASPIIESETEQNVAINISSNAIAEEIINSVPLVSDHETDENISVDTTSSLKDEQPLVHETTSSINKEVTEDVKVEATDEVNDKAISNVDIVLENTSENLNMANTTNQFEPVAEEISSLNNHSLHEEKTQINNDTDSAAMNTSAENVFNGNRTDSTLLQDVNTVVDVDSQSAQSFNESVKINVIEQNVTSPHDNGNETVNIPPLITDVHEETNEESIKNIKNHLLEEASLLDSSQMNIVTDKAWTVNDFLNKRNLLNANEEIRYDESNIKQQPMVSENSVTVDNNVLPNSENESSRENVSTEDLDIILDSEINKQVLPSDVCHKDHCPLTEQKSDSEKHSLLMDNVKNNRNYWESLIYVSITAFTALLFSLGYYYIENTRQDVRLIEKINKLEKELMISTKECANLEENLTSTSRKLNSIENESFGSNEMVLSLKTELEASKKMNEELEEQVATLEKELESASEAGLELERMLREVLSSNSDDNPLAQSLEDLQTRLDAQQAANESLTNALNLKVQENDTLSANLAIAVKKNEQLEVEVNRLSEELKAQTSLKIYMEQNFSDQVQRLELQLKNLLDEKSLLRNQLKLKECEIKEFSHVVKQIQSNQSQGLQLNIEKLYDVAHVKAEAAKLMEERDDLKMKLSDVEGAHHLLEEHVKIVEEQVAIFSEQCKLAEKEKKDAETRLEVLSKFFEEKEAQRQKEEAVWLQKQGEVSSTVERLQTLQNEIHNYKQQVEMLKREIIDQEKEYKSQIAALETKSHEHWVLARQTERKLEESKAEASQLRNRLTLIEKNMSDIDPEAKLHRLEANGETATSSSLFLGAESSTSPVMFAGSAGVPPPPLSYMCGPFPPFLPPPLHTNSGIHPYDVGQRPPPLGGRLSSPPPMHMPPPPPPPASGRYDSIVSSSSPPPPLSPPLPHPYGRHRSPPPPPHFPNDLPLPPGTAHSWGEEPLPPIRNSGFSNNSQHQREQRSRIHKGSLHSSGESLDRTHSGKV